ncbi:MAG: hypothetical protein IT446_12125 [Phycisphaerales bacterium]|nr:hypothetical protein [Phycisphaerales bacterium]
MRILVALMLLVAATAANAVTLPFVDDFGDSSKSGKSWTTTYGTAEYHDGQLLAGDADLNNAGRIVLNDSEGLTDYSVELTMRIVKYREKRGHAGIRVRDDGKQSLYIHVDADGRNLYWQGHGPLAYNRIDVNPSDTMRLVIECQGTTVKIYFNGKLEKVLTNVTQRQGGIVLFAYQCQAAFDDVKVTALEGEPTTLPDDADRNLISNSGFENATAPNLPDYWGTQAWGLADDQWVDRRQELWNRWKRDEVNPYEGRYSMRVDAIKYLASTLIYPREGTGYTLSAYLRSDVPQPIQLIYYNYRDGTTVEQTVQVEAGGWKRYELPVPTIDRDRGFISIQSQTGEHPFWVDAVQFEQGPRATTYVDGGMPLSRESANRPTYTATRADAAIALDGRIDDAAWKSANWVNLSLINGSRPVQPTQAAMLFDNDNLYIAMRCHEKQPDQALANVHQRDGQVWKDDCVEIFLDTAGTSERYFHLGVSLSGAQYDALKNDPAFNMDWDAVVWRGSDEWTVDIKIPFKSLNLAVQDQGGWRFNLCRENPRSGEVSAWSPTFGTFHNMDRFGQLAPLPADILSAWLIKPKLSAASTYSGVGFPVDGKPSLLYGLAWQSGTLPGPNAFAAMRKAGFNAAVIFLNASSHSAQEIRKVLDLAESDHIGVIYWVGAYGEPGAEHLDKIRYAITTFKDHPAVKGWMILDEPHANAEIVQQAYDLAKQLDPTRPALINLTSHGLAMKLAGLPGDVIAVDSYGINFDSTTIADIGPLLRRAGEVASVGHRPVLVFIQGMANCLQVWRGPTPAEQTAQTYISMVNGATVIVYFTAFPLAQDTWSRTISLAAEIRELTPVLLQGVPVEVSASSSAVEYTCRRSGDELYLIAVNPGGQKLNVQFSFKELNAGQGIVLFEDRSIAVDRGMLADQFEPYSRHVYRLKMAP